MVRVANALLLLTTVTVLLHWDGGAVISNLNAYTLRNREVLNAKS